jgi:glyoxylase-like metal-dependent hydrolase (beta-lactamase superfamily II)
MIRLVGELWAASGERLTHPWDASAYLINGDEPTLIDCGSTIGYPRLKQHLESFGYRPRDITRVIATHGHWDHLSGMSLLREESDAKLYMHAADREQVETGDYDRTASFLYGQPFSPLHVDGTVADGDVLHVNGLDLEIYHTPGHSPGSISILTRVGGLGLLIAGDTVAGGYHPRLCSDLDAWEHSLDRILTLDFDAMTIGHSPVFLIFNAKKRVRTLRQRFGGLLNPWFELAEIS